MSWRPEVDELGRRRGMAMEMGGTKAVARPHAKGRLTVRENAAVWRQQSEPYRSPFRAAEAFDVEEIIDPGETRAILCEFVRNARDVTRTQLGPRWRRGVRP